jgi:hypothetical protein
MANKAKIAYMIECQTKIAQGLERSLKVLREEADNEMVYTHLSEHSPYYAKAISQLETRRKLALAKIDILNQALTKE